MQSSKEVTATQRSRKEKERSDKSTHTVIKARLPITPYLSEQTTQNRHTMQDFLNNLLHHTSMQAHLAGRNHTMGKNRAGYSLNIIWNDIRAPMDSCVCLGSAIQCQRPSRTHPQINAIMMARSSHQFNNIAFQRRLHAYPADHPLQQL